LVVAGRARSTAEMSSLTALERAVALRSEQTASGASGTSAAVDHSRRDCESRLIEGTRKSTLPPAPTTRSASRSEVNVLPVPQAMISLPRSPVVNPASTSATARTWWGRSWFLGEVGRTSGLASRNFDQSTGEACSSAIPIRRTGICWPWIASSACAFHRSVVETMIRSAKPSLPDADRNESMASLSTVECDPKNLHWIATLPPVRLSTATRSMPVSCLPPRPGHSCHNHTSLN